ncbi:TldD/PmbA family protein [Metallosphaera tengchongensis]|uniref:TldD/PmbA family protein n=1 Tax=Metallosphaera tengchongensis TaxID=1532350 RepID=A0A6N0NXS8_9CREN|nr:TldD/PmbA family protein [Metallosphaera tengchongensis]
MDQYAILEISSTSLVVKVVESKVEAVQRLKDRYFNVLLRKGRKFLVTKVTSMDNLEGNLAILDNLPDSKVVPSVLERSGKFSFSKTDQGIMNFMGDASRVAPLLNSRFPIYGTLTSTVITKRLVTSSGFEGEETRTWFQGYFRAKNGDYSGQWAFASTDYDERKIKASLERAEEFASYTGKIDVSDGVYDVILSPLTMGNLMMSTAYLASGYSIITGNSFLSNKRIGEQVASEKFTLRDIPKGEELNSWEFDDEAVPTMNKSIVERGKYVSPLLNLEVAEVMDMKSTGNAGWVYPRPWTLEVSPGEVGEGSLMDGNVILFNNNWYTRFQNRTEGQFSTVGRDATLVIRNGKPVGVAGRVRIADKLGNLLSNIYELSKERYSVAWWDAPLPGVYPYALIKNVHLSKA